MSFLAFQLQNTSAKRNLIRLIQVQTQLSPKRKTFSRFLIAFLKSTLKSEYFERKDESNSLNISKIIDWDKGGYLNVPKGLSQNTLWQSTC